ncbi:gas vesicle protein [Mycobacterium sp. OAE908]|uniref:gas vesicle protein GvpO n=1 Tax=Mycobacterium sp. OAE908 TaxID=2817899 RepID=UPI001AE42FED
MAQRTQSRNDPPLRARDAAEVAREFITELNGSEPVAMTSVELTDADGWVVEFEVVEDRRIPSSADVLALYEVELDADGELLGFRRTRRYLRGQTRDGSEAT